MAGSVKPIEERRLLGIAFVLVGYLSFTIIDSCAKWLSASGLPTSEVVFIRYAGQFILVAAFFHPTQRRRARHAEAVARGDPWPLPPRLDRPQLHRADDPAADHHAVDRLHDAADPLRPLDPVSRRDRRLAALARDRRRLHRRDGHRPAGNRSLRPGRVPLARHRLLHGGLHAADPQARRRRLDDDAAVLRLARRDRVPAPLRLRRLAMARRFAGWSCFVAIGAAALIGHQFITTRPPLRAGLGARAVRLLPDHLHDRLELVHLQPAARRLALRRRARSSSVPVSTSGCASASCRSR